jgi:hypothetical protein
MRYIKTFTEIKESEQFKNTFSDDSLNESFFRLPSNIIGNDLYLAAKNLNSFYDSANSGNDIDPGVLDSIIKKLNMIKKAAKKFNSAEEVKGTVFESLDEAVQVDTSRYERSHRKKPRGKGSWAFYFDRTGGDAMFTPSAMTYADAVNWAKEQAKEAGKSIVYVGESVNEEFLNEKKDYQVYHNSYTSAIDTALEYAENQGYTYDKDETFTKIGMGDRKPQEGVTNKITITLFKNGKEQKRALQIQVYGMRNRYELNTYIA